jgi:hypothetical protein
MEFQVEGLFNLRADEVDFTLTSTKNLKPEILKPVIKKGSVAEWLG